MFELTTEIGFWLAGFAFLALTVVLAVNYRDSRISRSSILLAIVASASSFLYAVSFRLIEMSEMSLELAGVARIAVWVAFLGEVLRVSGRPPIVSALIAVAHGVWVLLAAIQVYPSLGFWVHLLTLGIVDVPVLHLIAAVLVILLIEQVYRNAREGLKPAIRFVGVGLGVPAAYELCLAAHTVLFGVPSAILAVPHGYVVAIAAPLIAVGLQRVATWDVGIFVSRQIVFYTTSFMATGIYLMAMSFAGYSIQSLQLPWGGVLQGFFFTAAIGLFLWILFSDSISSAVRVWLHKHFYENKYDYRNEWLRLTETLSTAGGTQSLGERCVYGLAQIAGAESGTLWTLDRDEAAFVREFSLGKPLCAAELPVDHPLIEFIEVRRWVLDMRETRRKPDSFASIGQSLRDSRIGDTALIVPLQHEIRLLGIVELDMRPGGGELNYEDHDLLKTAGRQVASYLAQRNTSRLLAESRQFEAFNKFTAFVMHDLNNLVAQQRLIVENAKRFRGNPDFVDDAFMTIESSVRRMDALLKQLRERGKVGVTKQVDIGLLIKKAISRASERQPIPRNRSADETCIVRGDPDRLEAVIGHMIRNAQEATDADGFVAVTASRQRPSGGVQIEIADDGVGMDIDFVRDQLFSPFVSTKGSKGMGIGVYQTREYLRMLGGELTVSSEPGKGTTMRLTFPAP